MRHCLGPWDSMQRSIDHQPINSFKPTLLNCRRASKCAARQKQTPFFPCDPRFTYLLALKRAPLFKVLYRCATA